MDNALLFHHKKIIVSNTMLVANGKFYSISNLCSVKSLMIRPKRSFAIFYILFGLSSLFDNGSIDFMETCLIVLGLMALLLERNKYAVVLKFSDHEQQVLLSEDSFQIQKIIYALNAAINTANKSINQQIDLAYQK